MCGRYASTLPAEQLARIFAVSGAVPALTPSWNIAPSQAAPVVRHDPRTGRRRLDALVWGLLPHWAQAPGGKRPINARAETVATAPFFRDAFARRRAIVPAAAFYEWAPRPGGGKQPYAIAARDGAILALAGVWEGWRGPDGAVIRSFAIVVTAANATMAPIHARMPVILAPEDWSLWLGETQGDPAALLRPARDDVLRVWPVSARVNRPAENDEGLLAPTADQTSFPAAWPDAVACSNP